MFLIKKILITPGLTKKLTMQFHKISWTEKIVRKEQIKHFSCAMKFYYKYFLPYSGTK